MKRISENLTTYTTDEASESADISFEELYANNFSLLRHIASQYNVRDPEATAQDAFVKAYENYDKYKDTGFSRRTWLTRILHNTARDELRKSNKRMFDMLATESDLLQASFRPDQGAQDNFRNIELEEIMNHINDVVSAKSPNWYGIFTRRVLNNDMYREISDDLDIPEGTVKASLFRACKLLASDEEILATFGK
ncbi:sigma-70 family RNA polymerase sigma factor [Candidatus Saccharibacteria bacterium]|nr:sigma-70 family RNA polymerase sigma factor [Candidatus Saccharibacteria bacterium]